MTSAKPPEPAGPTALALAGLRAWLIRALGDDTQVVLALPDAERQTRVCVWPVGLLADQGTRGGVGQPTLRLRARYVVTADGPIDVAVALLDRVLVAAAGEDRYRLVLEPVPEPLWGVGRLPMPAVLIDVPIQVTALAPVVPRVMRELRFDGAAMRAIRGQVLGPHNIPLAGMTVAVPATGASVATDARGGFTLPGQPAGHAVAIQLSGRGLHLEVDVAPGTTDPVVIHVPAAHVLAGDPPSDIEEV